MLEQSEYVEVEDFSSLSEEYAQQADEPVPEPSPDGSGLLYAQYMLKEALEMTRRRTGRGRYGISTYFCTLLLYVAKHGANHGAK
jgi:hypothetical protein